jgi:hypothetical protein
MEFQRKGRSLDEIEDWKAVEFRTFLLYSGPIVLKGVLSEEQYEHFLYFHTAIRILCSSSSTEEQITYAEQCLKYFSFQFGVLYGSFQLIYNVHSINHLADDCRFLKGSLDCFSAFPFENFLGRLKKMLRGTRRPLAQLKKRLSEIDNFGNYNPDCQKHHYGPYQFNFSSINVKSSSDCYVINNKCEVFKLLAKTDQSISFVKYCLKDNHGKFSNLFDSPLKASLLKIVVADDPKSDGHKPAFSMEFIDFKNAVKCVGLNYEESLAFFLLLHNL